MLSLRKQVQAGIMALQADVSANASVYSKLTVVDQENNSCQGGNGRHNNYACLLVKQKYYFDDDPQVKKL